MIQLAGFVILARLLTPADFGLFAMVTAIIAFAALLSDFGLSIAGVQATSLSQAQKSGLFWLNTSAGSLGTVVVAVSAPLLAAFYGEPRVIPVAVMLAFSLVITSLAVQSRVELNRAGRFGAMAFQDVISSATALILATTAAFAGWGYWALVVQGLSQSIVFAVLATVQARWLPSRPAPIAELKDLIAFGGANLFLQLANLFSRTIDQVMIGREQGPAALGVYSRASQLVTMIFQQIVTPLTRVVLPRLSQTDDDTAFNIILKRLQIPVTYGLLGVLSAAIALADPLIPLVLGQDWRPVVPIFQILAVGAAFSAAGYIYYWGTLARARSGLLIAAELPGRVVMVIGAVALASTGAVWVAMAIAAGQALTYVIASATVSRAGINAGPLILVSLRPALLMGTACAVTTTCQTFFPGDWARLFVGAAVWSSVIGLSLLVSPIRRDVRQALRLAGWR